MLRYLAHHTIDHEKQWVDEVIEEGWTRTEGVFRVINVKVKYRENIHSVVYKSTDQYGHY